MIDFIKMHGLGNDFVLLDGRKTHMHLTPTQIRLIADRHLGVGCDQIMIMHPARTSADIYLQMLNADGSEAGACGNGTRCVASVLLSELGKDTVFIETISGVLSAWRHQDMISVNMGAARFLPEDIPFLNSELEQEDLIYVPFQQITPETATLVSMGNPHTVFFVSDVEAVELEKIGPMIEHHSYFPERTNVEFVQLISPTNSPTKFQVNACVKLRMRVWVRGAGVTRACGSGACAAAVAAIRRGLIERRAEIILDGGSLWIDVKTDDAETLGVQHSGKNNVIMTGPVSHSFSGQITHAFLQSSEV